MSSTPARPSRCWKISRPTQSASASSAFSVFAAAIVFFLLWQTGRKLTLTSVALALILGGALGNLYDRIRFHHVVDFLAVRIYHYNWPDFNVADSCIVIGACLLLLEIFRPIPHES